MNRRRFLKNSTGAALAAALPGLAGAAEAASKRMPNRSGSAICAYYFRAHMYTCVPRQIREDMEWMASVGTDYVCVAFLEQDFTAAYENHALIASEAARVGMRILGVPSRWGGLIAGAPKVPSLFSVLNPETWAVNEDGTTRFMPTVTGVMSSVHHPKTFEFFCASLAEMYRQHPAMAGFILDEPKCFRIDRCAAAVAALGAGAPEAAHHDAARDFLGRICAYAKDKWPDRLTVLFQQANYLGTGITRAGSGVQHLDYYGGDGRPWGFEDDDRMKGLGADQESGRGKILLSGKGEAFIKAAHAVPGRKSFLLLENHNLLDYMIEPLERNYAATLALKPDMVTYYYYPRNVQQADRVMEIIARNLRSFARGA